MPESIDGGYVPPEIQIVPIDYETERAESWERFFSPKPYIPRRRYVPPPSDFTGDVIELPETRRSPILVSGRNLKLRARK